jgi:phospholipid/cholesterol/gamma-HCH transport system substrate-binding protein
MKSFSERNPIVVGGIGIAITAALIVGGLEYHQLPFLDQRTEYSAYFAEAGGLAPGNDVQVSGFTVGAVSSVKLDGQRVLVTFKVDDDVHLGDRTEAAVKTKSLLGSRLLSINPQGSGTLTGPIALERTTPSYQLSDALGDLSTTIDGLDTDELSRSLDTLATTFANTPASLQVAVQGLGRFSEVLATRDGQLRELLANANKVTGVLAKRTDQVVSLVNDTNALLAELRTESAAVDQVSGNLSSLAQQLSGLIKDNKQQIGPALQKLNGVLAILSNRKDQLQESIKRLVPYATSLGESVSTGPWFNAIVANLLPGQFLQPSIDAAFSDLGLDPNVLLPSQLTDPQIGQPGTPPLPVPYPRTGQGGPPRINLPDAITGNPGDPRYPYREPPPAPPPGGPPPGPPVITTPEPGTTPVPGPTRVLVTAPNEPSPEGVPAS